MIDVFELSDHALPMTNPNRWISEISMSKIRKLLVRFGDSRELRSYFNRFLQNQSPLGWSSKVRVVKLAVFGVDTEGVGYVGVGEGESGVSEANVWVMGSRLVVTMTARIIKTYRVPC